MKTKTQDKPKETDIKDTEKKTPNAIPGSDIITGNAGLSQINNSDLAKAELPKAPTLERNESLVSEDEDKGQQVQRKPGSIELPKEPVPYVYSRGMIKMDVKFTEPAEVIDTKMLFARVYDDLVDKAHDKLTAVKRRSLHESVSIEAANKLDYQHTDINHSLSEALRLLETACMHAVKSLTR